LALELKPPKIIHVQKYRPDNIAYYTEWVNLIPLFPLNKLMSPILYQGNSTMYTPLALLVSLATFVIQQILLTPSLLLFSSANPFFIDLHVDSNTENDFINFFKAAIAA